MQISFKLSKEDYLVHQLFMVSSSKSITSKRNVIKWSLTLIYIGVGLLFLVKGAIWKGIVFALLGVLWYVFYPKLTKKRYKSSAVKFIEKNYKGVLDQGISLAITKNGVRSSNGQSETKVTLKEVDKVIELKEVFLLVLASSLTLIIPKSEVEDISEAVSYFSELGISYENRVDWEW